MKKINFYKLSFSFLSLIAFCCQISAQQVSCKGKAYKIESNGHIFESQANGWKKIGDSAKSIDCNTYGLVAVMPDGNRLQFSGQPGHWTAEIIMQVTANDKQYSIDKRGLIREALESGWRDVGNSAKSITVNAYGLVAVMPDGNRLQFGGEPGQWGPEKSPTPTAIGKLGPPNEKKSIAGSLYRERLSTLQSLGNQKMKLGIKRNYEIDGGVFNHIAKDNQGRILVGGNFHFTHQGQLINNLAVWENDKWTAFTSSQGEQKPLGQIDDIVVDSKNNIYVLSRQSYHDYSEEISIRKWNGIQWTTLGILKKGSVSELAIGPSDELYVCGMFESMSIQGRKSSIGNLAKYQNGKWQKVGSKGQMILDIAINSKGEVHGLDRNGRILKFSGGKSIRMASEYITNGYDLVFDRDDNLYVTGYFGLTNTTDSQGRSWVNDKDADGNPTYYSNVAKYDGHKWTNLNAGLKKVYENIAVDGNDIYFYGGRNITKKWDGNRFVNLDLNANYLKGIDFDNKGNLVALGSFKRTAESATDEDNVAIWTKGDRR